MKVFEGMQRELGFFDDQKFRVPRRGRISHSGLFLPASTNLTGQQRLNFPFHSRMVELIAYKCDIHFLGLDFCFHYPNYLKNKKENSFKSFWLIRKLVKPKQPR
jgi:hypothetical protein